MIEDSSAQEQHDRERESVVGCIVWELLGMGIYCERNMVLCLGMVAERNMVLCFGNGNVVRERQYRGADDEIIECISDHT